MSHTTLRVGGVPEHFNLPIHLAIESGRFDAKGIDLQWTTFRGGTGAMTKALRDGSIDVCILLTEGIITDILAGNDSKIISGYVNTSLTWGIHTGVENDLKEHRDIYDRQYAISRYGSGSHLMAIVDANSNSRSIGEDQFTVIQNIDGALESLAKQETDVFYWEKYTTKPYVDSGQLRRVGQFVTPWPCFMVAASDSVLVEHPQTIVSMLEVFHEACRQFMQADDSIPLVSDRYGLSAKDAEGWYHKTEWATHGWVSNKMLKSVMYHLKVAGIIDAEVSPSSLVGQRASKVGEDANPA